MLNKKTILSHLNPDILNRIARFHVFDEIDSTNEFLINEIKNLEKLEANKNAFICLANSQTKGRGRMGRIWCSPSDCNIYLSIARRLNGPLQQDLSVQIGEKLIKIFEGFGIRGLKIKWPNDILYENKKLAGILIETLNDKLQNKWVVIGMGINVNSQLKELPSIDSENDQIAITSLAQIRGKDFKRNAIVGVVVDELIKEDE